MSPLAAFIFAAVAAPVLLWLARAIFRPMAPCWRCRGGAGPQEEEMTAEGREDDASLTDLAAEFPGWEFAWWKHRVWGRRKPVTAFSEWVLRETADEARQEIRRREQEPAGG